jgi:membrane protease YdiL (CAAX protease family)
MDVFILAVFCTLAGFWLYYRVTGSPSFEQWAIRHFGNPRAAGAIHAQRLIGVCAFSGPALLAAVSFAPALLAFDYFSNPADPKVGYWLLVLAVLIIPMNLLAGGADRNLEVYPQIRDREWSLSTLVGSALSWTAYLLAYEWLFRGVLFFTALPVLGFWGAAGVNVLFYAFVHIPKGRVETIGAIPLGLVLCAATFQTGSLWVAFITHVLLALSNEWISLYRHPDIRLRVCLNFRD